TVTVSRLVGAETLEEPCVLLVPLGRQADIGEGVGQLGRPRSMRLRTRALLPAAERAGPVPDVASADVLHQAILRQHPTQAFADFRMRAVRRGRLVRGRLAEAVGRIVERAPEQ